MAILGGEFDEYAPPELLKQFEEVLSTKHEVSMSQLQKLDVHSHASQKLTKLDVKFLRNVNANKKRSPNMT